MFRKGLLEARGEEMRSGDMLVAVGKGVLFRMGPRLVAVSVQPLAAGCRRKGVMMSVLNQTLVTARDRETHQEESELLTF